MALPPFYLQIVDDNGEPIRVANMGNRHALIVQTITDSIVSRGVGVFRTEAHVAQDVKDALTELIASQQMTVGPAMPQSRVCPVCNKTVWAWRTYGDGSMTCVECTK